jgi:pimeloyl-ACP methyl ester carboxylesterase
MFIEDVRMSDAPLLFLHGGPGLNSLAEEALLGPALKAQGRAVFFWNEPSKLRPWGDVFDSRAAFSGCVVSASRALQSLYREGGSAVDLVCHSFSANLAYLLALDHPEWIRTLTLVAPAFHLDEVLNHVVAFAEQDLMATLPERARVLKEAASLSRTLFDAPMQEAIGVAAQDPNLFTHYWRNHEAMGRYFGVWSEHSAQLDFESYQAVMTEFAARPGIAVASPPVEVPTRLIFGAGDRIVHLAKERATCAQLFSKLETELFDQSGHFPHLEEPGRFLAQFESTRPGLEPGRAAPLAASRGADLPA